MRVLMVGGPYDGQTRDAPEIHDERGSPVPIPFFKLLPPVDRTADYLGLNLPADTKIDILHYELVEVWESSRLKCYEYHYQAS